MKNHSCKLVHACIPSNISLCMHVYCQYISLCMHVYCQYISLCMHVYRQYISSRPTKQIFTQPNVVCIACICQLVASNCHVIDIMYTGKLSRCKVMRMGNYLLSSSHTPHTHHTHTRTHTHTHTTHTHTHPLPGSLATGSPPSISSPSTAGKPASSGAYCTALRFSHSCSTSPSNPMTPSPSPSSRCSGGKLTTW